MQWRSARSTAKSMRSQYVRTTGVPESVGDLKAHLFVVPSAQKAPKLFRRWITKHVKPHQFALCSSHPSVNSEAISSGLGLGFISDLGVNGRTDFHQIPPSNEAWSVQLWLVTHIDLHRTAKVQAMLHCLKATQQPKIQPISNRLERRLVDSPFRLLRRHPSYWS